MPVPRTDSILPAVTTDELDGLPDDEEDDQDGQEPDDRSQPSPQRRQRRTGHRRVERSRPSSDRSRGDDGASAGDRLVGDVEGRVDDLEARRPARSSVMHSGGFVWIELLAIIVYRPFSRKYLPIAFISSEVPLNGVSGVHGSRLRTRSRIPNRPRLRCAPTDGCLAASRSWCSRIPAPSRAALLDQAVLLVDPDRRQRGGQRDRVATSRSARRRTSSARTPRRCGGASRPPRAAGTRTSGPWPSSSGRARRPSGRRRTSVPVRPKPGHHLVGDHQDAVAVADLADALRCSRRAGSGCRSCPTMVSRKIAAIVCGPS